METPADSQAPASEVWEEYGNENDGLPDQDRSLGGGLASITPAQVGIAQQKQKNFSKRVLTRNPDSAPSSTRR